MEKIRFLDPFETIEKKVFYTEYKQKNFRGIVEENYSKEDTHTIQTENERRIL